MKLDRQKVFNKCNGKCGYCGNDITIKSMQVDHIIPQSAFVSLVKNNQATKNNRFVPFFLNHLTEFDVNNFDNLLPTCRYCNKHKSSHHLELYRSEIYNQIERLNLRSSNYRIAKRYGLVQETIKPIVFYFETIKS